MESMVKVLDPTFLLFKPEFLTEAPDRVPFMNYFSPSQDMILRPSGIDMRLTGQEPRALREVGKGKL